ncbi:branched-chain amino acid ABC transporter permease [Cryptosporangium phraense]|uniref:Branched-chain amino acid ABC transporter permease n=1 Tax=Cryptosporangium phraense TaxID=2593070 RepID=A0A545AW17_9ACTN|nr:branched-chain amino acid ABC transporter permease [Cryptosporangium phraense]TQS45451.1 branched-chain amino acid ABC transporter permease [Cryptosporangium phraense]
MIEYLVAGTALGCTIALLASGFVVVHRVTGVVNFAQGLFPVVAGLSCGTLLSSGWPHGLSELAAVALAGVVGVVVGVVAIGKPGTPPLASLVITFGLGFLGYAVEIIVWGDQPRSFDGWPGVLTLGGVRIQHQWVLVAGVALVVFGLLGAFFGRTYLGQGLTACAANPYAARLAGINVRRMGLYAFGLAGLLGGVAGVLLTPLQSIAFDRDVALAVNGFAAAVLGGLDRPGTALAGGLLLGVGQTLFAGYVDGSFQTEVALGFMVLVMVARAIRQPVTV